MQHPSEAPTPLLHRLALFIALTVAFVLISAVCAIVLGTISGWFIKGFLNTTLREFIYDWTIALLSVLISTRIIDAFQWQLGWRGMGFTKVRLWSSLRQGALTAALILLACFIILLIGGWVQVTGLHFSAGALLGWLLFFIIQPLTEEIVMRSFLQNQLHRLFGPWVGLLLSAIVFGLLHLGNNAFTWIAGLEIMAGGLLMGLLFLRTQNIWAAFAMHAVWNFFQSVVLGFAVSGLGTYQLLHLQVEGSDWLTGGEFGLEGSLLSLVFLLLGIAYFWSASKNAVPYLAYAPEKENLLDDESNSV